MTKSITPSSETSELEALKTEIKALKAAIAKLQARLDEIEDELTVLRNLV